MASIPSGTGTAHQHAQSSTQPLASSSAEQPAQNNAGQPASSSAEQPATEYPDVIISVPECHTPDYPLTSISLLPSVGELHHHHEPIIAYHQYHHSPRPVRARSAEQPASDSRIALAMHRSPCKAPPPTPPWRLPTESSVGINPLLHPEVYNSIHPPALQNAMRVYDVSPYWPTPTIIVRMAFTGDFVCTLGAEFSMLGVCFNSRVIHAERYVSSVLQQAVRIAYIGNIRAPEEHWKIAELLLREHTDTIFVQRVPL